MSVTNHRGMPAELARAVSEDGYEKGPWRKSLTQLVNPARMDHLRTKHAADIEDDVSDRVWYTLARSVIAVFERNANEGDLVISEERLEADVMGWAISTEVKQQVLKPTDTITVRDIRVVTARVATNPPLEWEQLVNLQALFVASVKSTDEFRMVVDRVETVAVIRDWQKSQAAADPEYPQSSTVVIEHRLWSEQEAKAFLARRVRLFQEVEAETKMGGEPPECDERERWMKPGEWAAMKKGGKRASRTFPTRPEADEYVGTHPGTEAVFRPGRSMRCGLYCAAVAHCKQYAREVEQQGAAE